VTLKNQVGAPGQCTYFRKEIIIMSAHEFDTSVAFGIDYCYIIERAPPPVETSNATSDPETNRQCYKACRAQGQLSNEI
jgi:hypothetical protein